jgi:Arc/MetJ family transcription regulator
MKMRNYINIGEYIMKTTLDINDDILRKVMEASHSKTKKGAIVVALNEYLRLKKREELRELIGNYKDFDLTTGDLRKMRHER